MDLNVDETSTGRLVILTLGEFRAEEQGGSCKVKCHLLTAMLGSIRQKQKMGSALSKVCTLKCWNLPAIWKLPEQPANVVSTGVGEVAQLVKCLLGKHKDLSLKPPLPLPY